MKKKLKKKPNFGLKKHQNKKLTLWKEKTKIWSKETLKTKLKL